MTFKNTILEFVGLLLFLGFIAAHPLQASDNALQQGSFLPVPVPEKHLLALVSFYPLVVEDEIVGAVDAYDDAATQSPADYLELYNNAGDVLAVNWFDKFGIQRMAVDRGLLQGGNQLEGVFVLLLLEEDSI